MKRVSNNFIALLMILLMLTSLIGTTLISYKADRKPTISGEVPIQRTGVVSLTVNGTTNETTSQAAGAGGGGGGGGGAPQVHIVDFRIKEIYEYFIDKEDTVIVIFSDIDKYILRVGEYRHKQSVSFNIDGTKFMVKSDEITSIDFDRDNLIDMTIGFNLDGKIVFTLFHKPKTPSVVNPIISSQKISKELERPTIPEEKTSYIYLLILIIILIFIMLMYQHYKIIKFEKIHSKKLDNLLNDTNVGNKYTPDKKYDYSESLRQENLFDKHIKYGFIIRKPNIKKRKNYGLIKKKPKK